MHGATAWQWPHAVADGRKAPDGWRAHLDQRLGKPKTDVTPDDWARVNRSWEIALEPRTVDALRRWLDERETYPKYDDSDAIWLNRKGNPHNSGTLTCLLDKLCAEAGIDRENRDLNERSSPAMGRAWGVHSPSRLTLSSTVAAAV
jgi:hypothetical protein